MTSNLATIKQYGKSKEVTQRFIDAVGNAREAGAFIQSALLAVAQSPALQECTPESIMSSALRAATIGLYCDPSIGHAYIVPYKGKAQLIIGYKGLQQLALRTNKYLCINASSIYEGQVVEEDQLTGKTSIRGFPKPPTVIGYVAYFQLKNGYSKSLYMTVEEIDEHKKRYSKGWQRQDSAWQTNPKEMAMKTVLRLLLSRYGYLDPKAQAIMAIDDSSDDENIIEIRDDGMPRVEDVTPWIDPMEKLNKEQQRFYSDMVMLDDFEDKYTPEVSRKMSQEIKQILSEDQIPPEPEPAPEEPKEPEQKSGLKPQQTIPAYTTDAEFLAAFQPVGGFNPATFPLDQAKAMPSPNGKSFSAYETKALAAWLTKALAAYDAEQSSVKKAALNTKIQAVQTILMDRKYQMAEGAK